MNIYRTKFVVGLFVAAITFVTIPVLYISGTREILDFEQKKNLFFNINTAESYLNLILYRLGVSGNPNRSIVGKDGWLFLGNDFGNIVHYSRMSEFDHEHISESVAWYTQRQNSLVAVGAAVIQVLPPNKLSIYPEYAPRWLILPEKNITDSFAESAKTQGLEILDMREDLLARKNLNELLYYKTDSHWNHLAGLITYQRLIESLQQSTRLVITPVSSVRTSMIPAQGGGNSQLLKINGLLPEDYDTDIDVIFPGREDDICISKLDKITLKPEKNCNSQPNSMLLVTHPLLVVNKSALNDLSVVWYRDSFGTAFSSLMQRTFKTIWELPYHYYYFSNVECFVRDRKPDIVLFMSVERNLIARVMTDLPGPTPAAINQTCPAVE